MSKAIQEETHLQKQITDSLVRACRPLWNGLSQLFARYTAAGRWLELFKDICSAG